MATVVWHPLIFHFFVFSTLLTVNIFSDKNSLMTGHELRTSDIGSDCSSN